MGKILRFFSLLYEAYSRVRQENIFIESQKHEIRYLQDLPMCAKGLGEPIKYSDYEILAEAQRINHIRQQENERWKQFLKTL